MKGISKLFGRKEEQQPKAEKAAPAAEKAQGADEPAYGLQFLFESGESRMFTKLPIRIGRSAENEIVLVDQTVSASHARVDYDERFKGVYIEDLNSLNGLFINDQPTRKNVLQDGVRIKLGCVTLTFRDTGYLHPGA